jgi:hypothetical protein
VPIDHTQRGQEIARKSQTQPAESTLANNWLTEIIGVDVKTAQAARKRLESTLETADHHR